MKVLNFTSKNDYYNKKSLLNYFNVNRGDLYRYAVTVGSPSHIFNLRHHKNLWDICNYRIQLIDSFFEIRDSEVSLKNIEYLELSEKINLAYYMGMIFTQLIADKKFGIKQLFHIQPTDFDKQNSNYLVHTKTSSGKIPDLIGIDYNKKIHIFEAKASTKASSMKKSVDKGISQLESVKHIVFNNNSGQNYIAKNYSSGLKSNDDRYVVAVQPTSVKVNELVINVIDPLPQGGTKLELNIDYFTLKHYSFIMELFQNATIDKELVQDFCVIKNEQKNIIIGLKEEIFHILEETYIIFKKNKFLSKDLSNINGLFQKVSECLSMENISLSKLETWDIGVGNDGILVGVMDKMRK